MSPRRRGSIRLWQTELFIVVIVVAMLVLSGSLSAGLKSTLTQMTETTELRNASALAQQLQVDFPLSGGGGGIDPLGDVLTRYREIYGGGIWVYDAEGRLVESAYDESPGDPVLEAARTGGLEQTSYVASDLTADGYVVAAKALRGAGMRTEGVVVTSGSVDLPVAILGALRDRLWVTFWISLVIAGLLGFGFSQLISRRIQAMSDAAAAMAAGDFEQRLPTGLVPDEITDLAVSYNSMAATLGDAFGAIQESQRQIAAVVESMAEGVLAVDAGAIVRVANPEAVRLLGLAETGAAGISADDLCEVPAVCEIVHAGLAGKHSSTTAEIGNCVVLLHSTPLLDADGQVNGAVVLLADVTERHRLEDAQRRFVADASHEMRTPIAAIKGMLELLEDGAKDVPEVRDDFIRTMQLEIDRLGRLVADLLTLARLEAGSLHLQLTSEAASDLLGSVAAVLHPLAEQAGVTLAVDLPDPSVHALADRDRIVQVLLSFTDNALKHSPRGTTVHLRAARAGERRALRGRRRGTGHRRRAGDARVRAVLPHRRRAGRRRWHRTRTRHRQGDHRGSRLDDRGALRAGSGHRVRVRTAVHRTLTGPQPPPNPRSGEAADSLLGEPSEGSEVRPQEA